MNKKTRAKVYLAICVLMAIVGLILTLLVYALHFEGVFNFQGTDLAKGIAGIGLFILDVFVSSVGIAIFVLGVIGIRTNYKKLTR